MRKLIDYHILLPNFDGHVAEAYLFGFLRRRWVGLGSSEDLASEAAWELIPEILRRLHVVRPKLPRTNGSAEDHQGVKPEPC
jgi:hypothetical protein